MVTLNDLGTWVSLIGFPLAGGVILDCLVKQKSKEALHARFQNLSRAASRLRFMYLVGFIASAGMGALCIHVAGLTQKIAGLGGWRIALESAAPIALFLIIKTFLVDPLLFWGTGRTYAVFKGKDAQGRQIPSTARWFMMVLLLAGASLLTKVVFSTGEEIQDYGLKRIFPPTPVKSSRSASTPTGTSTPSTAAVVGNQSAGGSVDQPLIASPAHTMPVGNASRVDSKPESNDKQAASDKPATKPFSLMDLLHSFSLVIADFYANVFLFLNGATCFLLLLIPVRTGEWVSEHLDWDVMPKYIFSALSLVMASVLAVLLGAYQFIADK